LEPQQRRPTSSTHVLPKAYLDPNTSKIVAKLNDKDPQDPPESCGDNCIYFYPPSNGPPLLRLRPPGADEGPVVYWQLDGVDLDGNDKVDLDLSDLQLQPVPLIEGRVVSKTDGAPVIASLTFLSKALTGSAAQHASY